VANESVLGRHTADTPPTHHQHTTNTPLTHHHTVTIGFWAGPSTGEILSAVFFYQLRPTRVRERLPGSILANRFDLVPRFFGLSFVGYPLDAR